MILKKKEYNPVSTAEKYQRVESVVFTVVAAYRRVCQI